MNIKWYMDEMTRKQLIANYFWIKIDYRIARRIISNRVSYKPAHNSH